MYKVIGLLIALAMFLAFPAVSFAQEEVEQEEIDQENETTQGAEAEASGGGNANATNQNQSCQIVAGGDGECDQSQSVVNQGDTVVSGRTHHDNGHNGDNGHGGGVGGGSVHSVTLARTGFDAWVLALIGGVSLAGGLGLLVAQRRGRLHG